MSDASRATWERRTRIPLVVGAAAFLGAYAWPILDPDLGSGPRAACWVVGIGLWVLFGLDYLVRLVLAERRARFVRANWLDLLTLAMPMFRPLQALRFLVALNMLAKRGAGFVRGRVVASVCAAVGVGGFVAALAMLDAERANPEANIRSFGDAAWWAAVTVPTVGYGDRYPTTTAGRFIGAALMLTGIALLGVVTAAIASWFVEKMSEVEAGHAETQEDLAELLAEVRALRAELAEREDRPAVAQHGARRHT
ncbi:MAG: potassium channel family protein [Sporichthyaceae bacterium]